jgi:alpha-galactosidase
MKKLIFILSLASCINICGQKFNELALTPPMGWNSWNAFACDINEKDIRETADALVASGMKDAGYKYIVIDDCWHGARDSMGFIHPDPVRFPSGIKALADYIHSKGLKFGIYSDAGTATCGGRPGSRGHEYQDAITYAKWGVDYLKYDWCNTDELIAKEAYKTMRDALYSAKRPVVFSLCEWGNNKPWLWGAEIGHLWRTTGDITASWNGSISHGESWNSWSVLTIIDLQKDLRKYAGPGHWNDPDMLEVGNGMKINEDRAHFSMWAMLAAPLIAGNDLRKMSKETTEILTNKEVIAVDQDPLGIQCYKYTTIDDVDVYVKPLKNDELAVCFLNRSDKTLNIEFNWKKNYIDDQFAQKFYDFSKNIYLIRDLWAKAEIGNTSDIFKSTLSGHNVIMLRLKRK